MSPALPTTSPLGHDETFEQGEVTSSAYLVLREEGTTYQAYCPQEALRESKRLCPQLLERAGQSVHWIGESWETTQVPWPFLGTQLLEGEGLERFLERGGSAYISGCGYWPWDSYFSG